jgi:hypothetical protein
MRAGLASALLAAVAIGGCGGSAAGGRLAASDAATLHQDVGLIRAAAAARNAGGADAAAAKLRGDVGRLLDTGRLSAGDGQLMLRAVAEVDRRISVELQTPAPPAGGAVPPGPGEGHGKGHGHGHGQGEGQGQGDGGD